jgi:hypothetical protein
MSDNLEAIRNLLKLRWKSLPLRSYFPLPLLIQILLVLFTRNQKWFLPVFISFSILLLVFDSLPRIIIALDARRMFGWSLKIPSWTTVNFLIGIFGGFIIYKKWHWSIFLLTVFCSLILIFLLDPNFDHSADNSR